ncbi:MAG: hypothetical protein U0792_07970 [Gemmataceae bacterium]
MSAAQSQLVDGDGDVGTLMHAVRQLESRRKDVADKLAAAGLRRRTRWQNRGAMLAG